MDDLIMHNGHSFMGCKRNMKGILVWCTIMRYHEIFRCLLLDFRGPQVCERMDTETEWSAVFDGSIMRFCSQVGCEGCLDVDCVALDPGLQQTIRLQLFSGWH